jgi:hypothetical protein
VAAAEGVRPTETALAAVRPAPLLPNPDAVLAPYLIVARRVARVAVPNLAAAAPGPYCPQTDWLLRGDDGGNGPNMSIPASARPSISVKGGGGSSPPRSTGAAVTSTNDHSRCLSTGSRESQRGL